MPSPLLPPLKPLPMKDRISMIFIQYGQIDVLDGAFVVIDKNGVRTHIPVGSVAAGVKPVFTPTRIAERPIEPPCVLRRPRSLRRWSHEEVNEVLTRSP